MKFFLCRLLEKVAMNNSEPQTSESHKLKKSAIVYGRGKRVHKLTSKKISNENLQYAREEQYVFIS